MRLRALAATGTCALFLALTAAVLHLRPVRDADESVSALARAAGLAHPRWVSLLRLVTHGGDGAPLTVVGVLACVLLLVARRWRDLAVVAVGVVATGLLLPAVQGAVGRQRPVDGFVTIPLPAFPSGHTVHATTGAALVLLVAGGRVAGGARFALVAAAVAWPVVVGATRVGLLAHWPSDVVGGWLLASAAVLAGSVGVDAVARAAASTARPGRSVAAPGAARAPADRTGRHAPG